MSDRRRLPSPLSYALLGVLVATPSLGQGVEPMTADQLLSITSVVSGSPEWSPDGTSILMTSTMTGGLALFDPEGGPPRRVPLALGGSGHFLASQMPGWSPDGAFLSYVSTKSGAPEIWLWSSADGSERRLTGLGARINSMTWAPDGCSIAFAGDRHGNYDVWTVSVPEGRVTRLTSDPRYEVFPTWTPDGAEILFVRLDERWADHEVLVVPREGGDGRTVVRDEDFFDYGAGTRFGYPRVSPDGSSILFPSHRSGWINYWIAPFDGGELRPMAAAPADQHEARWSPDGRSIVYTENHDGRYDLRVVSARGGEPVPLFSPSTGRVGSPAWSPDGRSIAYTFQTLTRPADLFVIDNAAGAKPSKLTESMPAGGLESRLVVPEKVRYESTDGFTISAYLYRARGLAPGEKGPGILWIHGGPTGQYRDMFEPFGEGGSGDAQYFAQRGYTVLHPNIRGSSGYGKAFEDGNNGCWGHCDLEDVLAGAEFLKTLPEVDGGRLGITGTSYGGIMSMNAATFAPGAFQAAIPASGYADWVHFFTSENELRHVKLLEYELGPFETHQDLWREASSIYRVADVATPLLLVHGVGRYPGSDQSERFAQALRNHYKPFRYETYPDENYYVLGRDNRKKMFADMLAFFEQYLGDGAVTPASR